MIRSLNISDTTVLLSPCEGSTQRRTVLQMVAALFGDEAVYDHTPDGAPFVRFGDKQIAISVSHCKGLAALAYNPNKPVGIDIETERTQLQRIAPRIFSPAELEVYSTLPLLLKAWTLKEALYKSALTPGLDFRADIHLPLRNEKTAEVASRRFRILYSDYLEEYPEVFMSLTL